MSNPSVVSINLPSLVSNGIALSQSLAAAGPLIFNGSLVSGGIANLGTPQRVFITSAGNDSGITWTITGTNRGGQAISEVLAGSNVAINSVLDYLRVTSIVGSGATASTVTAGTGGVGSTDWILDNFLAPGWYLSLAVQATGTVTYTIEHTYDDPNATNNQGFSANISMEVGSNFPPTVWPNASATSIANANIEVQYANQPIMAHRLTVNSGTGTAKLWSIQAGIGSP